MSANSLVPIAISSHYKPDVYHWLTIRPFYHAQKPIRGTALTFLFLSFFHILGSSLLGASLTAGSLARNVLSVAFSLKQCGSLRIPADLRNGLYFCFSEMFSC